MDEDTRLFSELAREVNARYGADTYQVTAPLFADLWARRDDPLPTGELALPKAEALGRAFVAAGTPMGDAVRVLVAVGYTLVDVGERTGALSPGETRRLQFLTGEAAAQVAGSMERAQRLRRDAWLSFLTHELKNPLNTVLNALWLIREKGADPGRVARFVDMAERAARRLEGCARDVRELEERLRDLPPGWVARPQSQLI
jgi:signal transduction histidine kinase